MEYITTQDLFVGELNTILDQNCAVDETLQYFIELYEPKIIKEILGQKFFNLLQTELAGSLSGDWDILVNGGNFTDSSGVVHQFKGLKYITASFIFYWYHRNNHYNAAQTGGSFPLREGGVVKSMSFKQMSVWNSATELIKSSDDSLKCFLDNSSLEDYCVNLYEGGKIKGLQWL